MVFAIFSQLAIHFYFFLLCPGSRTLDLLYPRYLFGYSDLFRVSIHMLWPRPRTVVDSRPSGF